MTWPVCGLRADIPSSVVVLGMGLAFAMLRILWAVRYSSAVCNQPFVICSETDTRRIESHQVEQRMRHYTASVFHKAEVELIQSKLAEFLFPHEARELTMQVCNLVTDVDIDIDTILQDPLVGRLYEYDGQFFTPRGAGGFHTAFDGLHILKSLTNCIDTFFKARPKHFAIRWLLDELNIHRWVAARRRMNWAEFGTFGLIPEEAIQEIMDIQRQRASRTPPPLSAEEQAFFESFEEELRRTDL